jgi:hypothetical protein
MAPVKSVRVALLLATIGCNAPAEEVEPIRGLLNLNTPEGRDGTCGENYNSDGLVAHSYLGGHSCASGYAMVGAYLNNNTFICAAADIAVQTSCLWVQTTKYYCENGSVCNEMANPKVCSNGAACVNMLSCQDGYVMAGYHAVNGKVLCCAAGTSYVGGHKYTTSATQQNWNVSGAGGCPSVGVHMCESSLGTWAMQGIHAGSNLFGCTQ